MTNEELYDIFAGLTEAERKDLLRSLKKKTKERQAAALYEAQEKITGRQYENNK